MRITSPKTHWTRVGRIAAQQRLTLGQALTNNDAKIDGWIAAGFKAMKRRIDKRECADLGSADTMALVKRKLGF